MFFSDADDVSAEGVVDVFGQARVGGAGVEGNNGVVGDGGLVLLGDFVECEVHAAGFYFLGMKIGHNNNTTLQTYTHIGVVWYSMPQTSTDAYGSFDEPRRSGSASWKHQTCSTNQSAGRQKHQNPEQESPSSSTEPYR